MFVTLVLIAFVVADGYATSPTPPPMPTELHSLFTEKELATVIMPTVDGKPLTITVNMFIRDVELKKDHIHVIMTLRQEWNDNRLKNEGPSSYINFQESKISQKIWTPDLFWQNSISPSRALNDGLIRINKNGNVLYSVRTEEHFRCRNISMLMDAGTSIECHMHLSSYGHTMDELIYKPKPEKPVQLRENVLKGTAYEITNTTVAEHVQETNTGKYQIVKIGFTIGKKP